MLSASPYKTRSLLDTRPEGIDLSKWQNLCELVARSLKAPVVQIKQANEQGIQCLTTNSDPSNPYRKGDSILLSENAFCHKVVRYSQPLYIADASDDSNWQDNPDLRQHLLRSYYGIPLNWPDGTAFGVLAVQSTTELNIDNNAKQVCEAVKDHIDTELKYIHILQKYQALSERDEMTNLMNRRGFFKNAEQILEIAIREERAITIGYFDLNNLKWINDTLGQDVGDLYISSFGAALTEITRKSDVIGRLGGDEFALLSLMSDGKMMRHIIDRLHESFKSWLEDSTIDLKATFSSGYKTFEAPHTRSLEEMLKEADELMLQQKLASREKLRSV